MDTVHKDILRKNRCDLVKAIQNVEKVVFKLVEWGVFDIYSKAEILVSYYMCIYVMYFTRNYISDISVYLFY